MFQSYLLAIFFIGFGNCAPSIDRHRKVPTPKALEYMKRYGYIEMDREDSAALYTAGGISENIKVMQRYGGIEETGVFDEETEKLITSRRCGVPDIIHDQRQKRYVLGPEGWEKRNISYFLSNWYPSLGEEGVQKNIQKALDQWGDYGRLKFYRKYSPDADIIVQFAARQHGDSFPFDGRGSILAHAFFPHKQDSLGGDIHFDADENWVDSSNKSNRNEEDDEDDYYDTDFYSVALHELGHSLGLAHSPVKSSIMFPYYQSPDENGTPQLGYDDILAMYDLYIRRTLEEDNLTPENPDQNSDVTTTVPSTTDTYTQWSTTERDEMTKASPRNDEPPEYPTTPSYKEYFPETSKTASNVHPTVKPKVTYEGDDETVEDHKNHDSKHNLPKNNSPSFPDICDGHVDAIANLRDELFVFRDEYIWRYSDRGVLVEGYPVKLREMFPTLPETINRIDAAYQRPSGEIVLFTGNKFWVHNGSNFLSTSPESLTHLGLPEYLTKLDAVQNWQRNKKTYFYAMDRFWRYNETSKQMDPGYPQHMEKWRGVPSYLDAATTWKDGITYFFRGGLFWKFDNDWIMITDESPMPAPTYWFGCPEKNNVVMGWFLTDPN